MEYQSCVSSGNKKAARVEAALACLQELAAVPANKTVASQPPGVPRSTAVANGAPTVANGAPRPAPCPPYQPSQAPKPVRPLMALQPRPQFASLYSYRPPNPAQLPAPTPAEPPPPGVDVADFTSDVFDDLEKFESTVLQMSAGANPAAENASTEHEQNAVDNDATESSESQLAENSETSGAVGLPGDSSAELEADDGNYADGTEYDDASEGYIEFFGGSHTPFFQHQPVRNVPGIFGQNFENIHPGANTGFGEPRGQFYPDWLDSADDTFVSDEPSILEGIEEPCDDYTEPCEDFEPWEEDFKADTFFQNPVGFGPRGMRPARPLMRQPFHVRGPGMRPPFIASPRPRIFQRFPRDCPPQQFPHPSFESPLRGSLPLPRGLFRPRMHMRPPVRPFLRDY